MVEQLKGKRGPTHWKLKIFSESGWIISSKTRFLPNTFFFGRFWLAIGSGHTATERELALHMAICEQGLNTFQTGWIIPPHTKNDKSLQPYVDVQGLQKVFTPIDFFHILLCYSLNLK
jgi:hypothetical protein